jgi:hypothetical protein
MNRILKRDSYYRMRLPRDSHGNIMVLEGYLAQYDGGIAKLFVDGYWDGPVTATFPYLDTQKEEVGRVHVIESNWLTPISEETEPLEPQEFAVIRDGDMKREVLS